MLYYISDSLHLKEAAYCTVINENPGYHYYHYYYQVFGRKRTKYMYTSIDIAIRLTILCSMYDIKKGTIFLCGKKWETF